ncbi:putative lipase [Helicobacter fennelliae]|nr:putative lipase [Helicobacter fennelliae]
MTSKKRINKIKDMAEVADAGYAMLYYVFEDVQ